MDKTIPVDNGAEAFLELLNAGGVEYIFLNPGTDTYPVQEAVSKFQAMGRRAPQIILCLHESVALAAAHGYFMVSGKPQVVFVHADLGLQQVGGALHNAQRGRTGVVLCSGKVPNSLDKARMNQVHWLQEQFDQAGTVRNYVKWEYELRTTENIHHVVQRALQVASSEPCGPVYLAMPQDVLVEKMTQVTVPDVERHSAISYPGLDSEALSAVTRILLAADNPLIITGYSGRHVQTVGPLVDLAEALGARVVCSPTRMNFPTTHPLFAGFDASPYLGKADAVLILDQDVAYVPARVQQQAGAQIIHIDIDPLKERYPMWGFPADVLLRADTSVVVPALSKMLRDTASTQQKTRFSARSMEISAANEKMKKEWRNLAAGKSNQQPISPEWACYCINEVLDDNALVLGEVVTNTATLGQQLDRRLPGTFFQSGGSNLGWGLGAALGAKLAGPDKTVVTLEGDGGFVFGCPTAALWAAATFHAPFLCIILNNMQYTAPKLTLKMALGVNSYCVQTGNWVGSEIKPSPDYAAIARACHAYGVTVEESSALKPSIQAALEQVRCGTPAVVEVKIDGSF
jgi:acetolactate synthase I/II/III large subunit